MSKTKGMAPPAEFEVSLHLSDRFNISWRDNESRYHVWTPGFGQHIMGRGWYGGNSGPVIYKNPLEGYGKTTYLKLESHPRIRAALDAIPEAEFEAAEKREAAREAERAAAAREHSITLLREEARALGFELVPIKAEAAE